MEKKQEKRETNKSGVNKEKSKAKDMDITQDGREGGIRKVRGRRVRGEMASR